MVIQLMKRNMSLNKNRNENASKRENKNTKMNPLKPNVNRNSSAPSESVN